tara:strand:- start:51221 stop:51931 length:711 start_codon:yes stop_codon:yes gene_type:complete
MSSLYIKLEKDWKDHFMLHTAAAIIVCTCLGGITVLSVFQNGSGIFQMLEIFAVVVCCNLVLASILTVQKPALVLKAVIASISICTLIAAFNFMGYNSSKTQVMIGLGVSSISDSWYSFAQNVKNLDEYQSLIEDRELPVYRGHMLTAEDLIIRKHISNLMCKLETSWSDESLYFKELPKVLMSLVELEKDNLVEIHSNKLIVTEKGRAYVRNVCLPFDLRLQRKKPETQLFSMTV